jgi:hypothetical protein
MAHVVSLEVAKRRKEAGYPQSSEHGAGYWMRDAGDDDWYFVFQPFMSEGDESIYAPDLGELIRELPDDYFVSKDGRVIKQNRKTFPVTFELIAHADTPEDACALAEKHKNLCEHGYERGKCPEICEYSSYHSQK